MRRTINFALIIGMMILATGCENDYQEPKATEVRVLNFKALFALNTAKLQVVSVSGTGYYRDVAVERLSETSFKLDGLLFTQTSDGWVSKGNAYKITLTANSNIGIGISGWYVRKLPNNVEERELWSIFYPGLPE